MANPDYNKECVPLTIKTCGKVRKMILDIHKKCKDQQDPKSQETIILGILKKEAEQYFK